MADIIQLAEQLGKAISESPEATALLAVRKEISAQPEMAQLMQDYQGQMERIASLERDNKPIEVDDKHKLRDLHDKLVAAPLFKKLTEQQMEYVDLMRKVNDSLRAHLAETERQ